MEKRHSVEASSLVCCGGCEEMFELERRTQRYHNDACKQSAYRQRRQQKRNTARGCATHFCTEK